MPKLTIDGQEIEVQDGITVLQACEQIGVEIPRFLLSRAAVDCRQLPHVPGRDGTLAKAGGIMRDAGRRRHGDSYQHARSAEDAQRRDGISADQPSAGLPDLRSGRRM